MFLNLFALIIKVVLCFALCFGYFWYMGKDLTFPLLLTGLAGLVMLVVLVVENHIKTSIKLEKEDIL